MRAPIERVQSLLEQPDSNPDEALILLNSLTNGANTPWPILHYIGVAYMFKKDLDTALIWLNKSMEAGDHEAITYHLVSLCYYNEGIFDKAEKFEKQALKKKSLFIGWMHLASIYRAQAKIKDALECYKHAVEIDPENTGITHQIAEIYRDNGRIDKAIELFESTTGDIEDQNVEAYASIAQLLIRKQEFDKAEELLNRILEEKPESVETKVVLSDLFRQKGDYKRALDICKQLLEENSARRVRINYAVCLQELGRFDEAEANYMKALEDCPDTYEALSNYLMCIHYNPEKNKKDIFEAHTLWDQHFAPSERPKRPIPAVKKKEKKLRIGLLSGGFRCHPVGWMITRGLEHLPREQFEVYCYTTDNGYDQITNRISAVAKKWRSVVGYDDKIIARMILEDEIDILIELSGHAAGNRLRTIAREPAPVIVKWVGGLFNTTGLRSVDFLITDQYETPEGEEPFYTEKLVRMPDDYICYNPPEYAPDVEALLPAEQNGYITFGCFNNPAKINKEILARWADIMARLPSSCLLLKSKQYDTEGLRKRIITKMNRAGISEERIIFKGQSNHHDHLSYYNQIDIALDPWPYSGGLTTCEALWMGVPVITKPGPTFAGRHSATHLTNSGFPEWITDSWEDYIDLTVSLSKNTKQLAHLRTTMRDQVADSPLCDGRRFGAHLSVAIREMWKQRVEGYKTGNEEWQDHVNVKVMPEQEIGKIAIEDSSNMMKPSPENGEEEQPSTTDHSLKNQQSTFSMKSNQQAVPEPFTVNGLNKTDENHSQTRMSNRKSEIFNIETKDGVTISTPADISLLTPYVLLEQEKWFESELAFVNEYLRPGMNVLDIGAGFGAYALPMAHLVGREGKVYAFEPGSLARRHLEMSKLKNRFGNLEIIGRAVANQKGKTTLQIAQIPELNALDETGTEEISQTTLDAWWRFEDHRNIDFIKLDVNGSEAKVLVGAEKLLSESSPVLLVAIGEGSREDTAAIKETLIKQEYRLYEYVPGLQLLAEHDSKEPTDSYLMNLIALKKDKQKKFAEAGWFYEADATVDEPEQECWKKVFRKLPWTNSVLLEWEKASASSEHKEYIETLNYFCSAEEIDLNETENRIRRSQKAKLTLKAVQMLLQLYDNGHKSLPVAMTLVRGLNLLGRRSQAVEVMKNMMEANTLDEEKPADLPFLLPLPQQDHSPVQADFTNWLTVRMVEAWISLKDVTTYLSGEQELHLLDMLDGNPETSDQIKKAAYLFRKKDPAARPNGERRLTLSNDELNTWFYNKSVKEKNLKAHKSSSYNIQDEEAFNTIGNLIKVNGPLTVENHNLPNKLIVSLTSYPKRFSFLPLTLMSLCLQSVRPNRIVLWIAHDDKKFLTREIKEFQKHGVEIKFCEDLKSYKKIIPALKKYSDSYIVTADDDLYYKKDWLKNLVQCWDGDNNIIAYRVHRINLNDKGYPEPYHTWNWQYRDTTEPSGLNFPTCGAGALFPPNIFHEDVTAVEKFVKLAPDADDVWLYWMARLNNAKIKVTDAEHPLIEWPSSKDDALWKTNILEGRNNQQIQNMIDTYGFPKDEINILDAKQELEHPDINNNFSGSETYWKNRYKNGGNSGSGSYGQLAIFKAEIINSFTKENEVKSLIEFGCGDGNQLKYLTISEYLGFDISEEALERCRIKHKNDATKQFKKVEMYDGETAKCSLSLDVIFHLTEDEVYNSYMHRLFYSAEKFVIIYSSNKEEHSLSPHVKHRLFTQWIKQHAPEWNLKKCITNKYQYNGDGRRTSFSDFYIYEKSGINIS